MPLAANAEPAAAMPRKFRLDDVIMVLAESLDGSDFSKITA
jgi:hypothetical protein